MRSGPGARRYGKLIRPRDAPGLVCKDGSSLVEKFAMWFCGKAPLRAVSGTKLETVDVQLLVENIEHDPEVECRRQEDRCWCRSRTVDKESIESCGIGEEIKRRLMNGGPEIVS